MGMYIVIYRSYGSRSTHFAPRHDSSTDNRFSKKLIRSFVDSGMQTQLKIIDLSIWPPLIKWSFLKIARPTPPDLPNSWVQIFKTIELSDCAISVWPGWFDLQVDYIAQK